MIHALRWCVSAIVLVLLVLWWRLSTHKKYTDDLT